MSESADFTGVEGAESSDDGGSCGSEVGVEGAESSSDGKSPVFRQVSYAGPEVGICSSGAGTEAAGVTVGVLIYFPFVAGFLAATFAASLA